MLCGYSAFHKWSHRLRHSPDPPANRLPSACRAHLGDVSSHGSRYWWTYIPHPLLSYILPGNKGAWLDACAMIPPPILRGGPHSCNVGYESSLQGPSHASVALVLGPELS